MRVETTNNFIGGFLQESRDLLQSLSIEQIEGIVQGLANVRGNGGRLFILGSGGSAGHASHAVNDFRKICGIESYSPSENVSELTARINDDGWDSSYANWLKGSNLNSKDALLIFSVGGGSKDKGISNNLVKSMELAQEIGAPIFGIVGRDGGYTKQVAKNCVVIPIINQNHITPHTEGLCAVIWHAIVSHPKLQIATTKWESTK
jgi:D-sedoheptulose 7-phosphate isomerase